MTAPKTTSLKSLAPLNPAQQRAVEPADHVWLNASAGTGKTQVLAARVLRLLLGGSAPDSILCITFTKAGAAEMAHRIHERLAHWVGCDLGDLRTDVLAIGLDPQDDALLRRARTLFARVIDSPAGAIRVQTIHSFCQSLLASFPLESEVLPGFRLVEGGEANEQRLRLLAEMLGDADLGAQRRGWLGQLSRRLGEKDARAFVDKAAALFARSNAARLPPTNFDLRAALKLPTGDIGEWVTAELKAGLIADDDVRHIAETAAAWNAATGQRYAEICRKWLASNVGDRPAQLADLFAVVGKKDGALQAVYAKQLADAADAAQRVLESAQHLLAMPAYVALADDLAAGWQLAADFAATWAWRKRAEGLAEFDDLIARTAALLGDAGQSDWIRFKLDQRIDHLLVDEAQDTNADQWTIASGLTAEFFVGLGLREDGREPSMFTVGDRKQAIFSFQGTDPAAFEDARQDFARRAAAAERPFQPLDLAINFRSGATVLAFVDRWLADGGAAAMGVAENVPKHDPFRPEKRPARVELWPPLVVTKSAAENGDDEADEGEDEESPDSGEDGLRAATDPASLKLSAAIADRVAAWIDPAGDGIDGLVVFPEDVMILVRSRGVALAMRIVAQLQARGVPVAGVDRFQLATPLAVQDLLAALRFTIQPDDEYHLACLLVSPLIGWTQDQLYRESVARGRTPLRQWLANSETEAARAAMTRLDLLRAEADFATPFRQLDAILSGPLQGRRAMVARLGAEANDAIDALLTAALDYESRHIPSLAGFLHYIDRAPLDIKRQTDSRSGLVRVMTVHGSKGLQAPIVILADATRDPGRNDADARLDMAGWSGLPLFKRVKAAEQPPRIADAYAAARRAQLEEHWRLYYVAATRAERLFAVTGTLPSEKPPPENSWFHAAAQTIAALAPEEVDIGWPGGPVQRIQDRPGSWARIPLVEERKPKDRAVPLALPGWLYRPAPAEARPPRPLAPSQLGVDDAPQRPAVAGRADAIRRGVLLHSLIERLPGVAVDQRQSAAERWLTAQASDVPAPERAAWAAEACAVLAHPDWRAIFGAGSRAEVPFSAVIPGGLVVAGTVDRLLVTDDVVLVVDYKTGAYVPDDAAAVAPAYLRQMSAYAEALRVIFPDRRIEAALLYTAAPRLIALPETLLVAHKPGFGDAKPNLPPAPLEPPPANA